MKLIKFTTAIASIYFAVLLNIYTQSEGRIAALMGMLIMIMLFFFSAIFSANEEDNNNRNDMR